MSKLVIILLLGILFVVCGCSTSETKRPCGELEVKQVLDILTKASSRMDPVLDDALEISEYSCLFKNSRLYYDQLIKILTNSNKDDIRRVVVYTLSSLPLEYQIIFGQDLLRLSQNQRIGEKEISIAISSPFARESLQRGFRSNASSPEIIEIMKNFYNLPNISENLKDYIKESFPSVQLTNQFNLSMKDK
jgi:hypothetical protein